MLVNCQRSRRRS